MNCAMNCAMQSAMNSATDGVRSPYRPGPAARPWRGLAAPRGLVAVLFAAGVAALAGTAASGQTGAASEGSKSLVAPGATVEKLAGDFTFLEGPAADATGNVYFTDVRESRIHRWATDGALSLVAENTGAANGLAFDAAGNLLACAGGARQLVSFGDVSQGVQGTATVLADRYDGKRLNSPNDLWIDPQGGIYFTDPSYANPAVPLEQDGEHVYYLTADRRELVRVTDDLTKPNGIIGSLDGKTLYVASTQPRETYAFDVGDDGRLSGKRVFAAQGSDGLTLDEQGNLYLTWIDGVSIYSPDGVKIETIAFPEWPANVAFGGTDRSTLFVTARTGLYALRMSIRGAAR